MQIQKNSNVTSILSINDFKSILVIKSHSVIDLFFCGELKVVGFRLKVTFCVQSKEMTLLTCSCTDRVLATVTPRIFMTSTRFILAILCK